jgi:hypothetical protein
VPGKKQATLSCLVHWANGARPAPDHVWATTGSQASIPTTTNRHVEIEFGGGPGQETTREGSTIAVCIQRKSKDHKTISTKFLIFLHELYLAIEDVTLYKASACILHHLPTKLTQIML